MEHLNIMSRVGSTMHGWAGYIHPQPKKIVYGCGGRIRAGSGPKRESGPTCGQIILGIGYILYQASQENRSGFTIILRTPIAK